MSSPLGAWLVLAMAAQAATTEATRDELEELLGLDAAAAATVLDELLRDVPDEVRAAVAAWGFTGADWMCRLSAAVETGPVPTQPQADAWARERTDGMIERFPADDFDELDGLLASALVTRVTWQQPFELADARELHSPWSGRVTQVLADDEYAGYFVDTEQAGIVAVHNAYAEGALRVTSVIAAADVDPADVLAAAHDIAAARAAGAPVPRRSLFDLPLGDGPFWTIAGAHMPGGGEHFRAVLPAWHATTELALTPHPELGFGAAARALSEASTGSAAPVIDFRQAAVARYGRYGFDAAAVAGGIEIGGPLPSEPARIATLRFGHPYAVVATVDVVDEREFPGWNSRWPPAPWRGMPLFSAWVAEPGEPSEVVTGS